MTTHIESVRDFKKIAKNPDGDFVLESDIVKEERDYSNRFVKFISRILPGSLFPISEFRGSFDGNGHSIVGYECPLFEENNGVIKNLHLEDVTVEDRPDGYLEKCNAGCIANTNEGEIIGCSIEELSMEIDGTVSGGITSDNYGLVKDCHVSGEIECINRVGGICGQNYGEVKGCHFEGNIKHSSSSGVGGIVGYNKGSVNECDVKFSILAQALEINARARAGGLIGYNKGRLENSYVFSNKLYVFKAHSNIGAISGKNIGIIRNCYHDDNMVPIGHDEGESDVNEIDDISNIENKILVGKI